MKKLFWIVPGALILLVVLLVVLIPTQMVVSEKTGIGTSQDGLMRLLTNKDRWQQWWPANQKQLVYENENFSFQQAQLKTAFVGVAFDDTLLRGQLTTLFYQKDSSGVVFQVALPPATNPLQKLRYFFKSKQLSNLAEEAILRLKKTAALEENIYGLAIRQEKVKDSAFVALRFETTGYPQTTAVYAAIAELRQYIQAKGATESAPPMLHANVVENQKYEVMVAIPVNRPLEGFGKIEPKRMVLGNILVAEVKGGAYTAEKAIETLTAYVTDRKRLSPAMPFQSLVTNRMQEPDTSKWITRVYFPVI